jgi:ribosomal protein S18 acetylase RimI-like enzyme
MNYEIRKALPADAPGVARVQVETWQSHYRGQLPDDYLDRLSIEKRTVVWTDLFVNVAPGAVDLVAVRSDGEILGFCSLGPSRDDHAPSSTGELYAIYVDVLEQGAGIGSALMAAGTGFLGQRFERATLWVLKSNARSIRFYESLGWRFDGEEKIDRNELRTFVEIRYGINLEASKGQRRGEG